MMFSVAFTIYLAGLILLAVYSMSGRPVKDPQLTYEDFDEMLNN